VVIPREKTPNTEPHNLARNQDSRASADTLLNRNPHYLTEYLHSKTKKLGPDESGPNLSF
jgi:hypothetical protein